MVLQDGRLASGGDQIKLWPKDGRGARDILQHGSPVWALAVLPDGSLASGGTNNQIKVWPKDGSSDPKVLLHDARILSLTVLPDGQRR